MKKVNSYFFSDNENNLWNIKLNNNGDMVYSSMYSENKWTREMKIDNNVIEFDVDIDSKQQIHIVYKKLDEIRYCIWDRKNWMGKLIYSFGMNEIQNINIHVSKNLINIFFVLIESYETSIAKIIHYCFGTEEEKSSDNFNIVSVVPVKNTFESYYEVEKIDDDNFYMFIKNYRETKINVMLFRYVDNKWSKGKKIYSLKGNEIKLYSAKVKNQIHVLNLYKENVHYIIEDIFFDLDGKFKHLRVYKGNKEIDSVLIMTKESIMYAMWNEKNNILSSCFDEVWSSPLNIDIDYDTELFLYKSIYLYLNKSKIKGNYIIGDKKTNFILPKDKEEESMFKDLKSKVYEDKIIEEKKIIRDLNDTVNSLNMELQKKESLSENLKIKLNSMANKYKDLEEELNISKKSCEDLQEELNNINDILEKNKNDKEIIVKDLKKTVNEKNKILKDYNEKLKELEEDLVRKNVDKENTIKELKEAVDEKNYNLKELNKKLEELEGNLIKTKKNKENVIEELKKSIDEKNYTLNELKDELMKKNQNKENIINELKEIINEKNQVIDEFNKKLKDIKDDLTKRNENKENIINELKQVINEKNHVLMEVNKKFKELEDTLVRRNLNKEDMIKELKKDIKERDNDLSKINMKLKELQSNLEIKTNELNNMDNEKKILLQNLNKKDARNKELEKSLNQALNEKKEFNVKLMGLSKDQEEVVKHLDNLMKEREETKNKLKNLNDELNLINKQKDNLIDILEKVNKENDNLKKQLNEGNTKSILSKILNWRE